MMFHPCPFPRKLVHLQIGTYLIRENMTGGSIDEMEKLSPEQIIEIFKEAQSEIKIRDICRKYGIAEKTILIIVLSLCESH